MAMFADSMMRKLVQAGYDQGKNYNHQGININLKLEHIDPTRNDLCGYKWIIGVLNSSFSSPIGTNILAGDRANWIFEQLEKVKPNYKNNHTLARFIHKVSLNLIDNFDI